MDLKRFYEGKTVLITGHTGFKGSWLSNVLIEMGANVIGYSLNPPTSPSMFELTKLKSRMISIIGDISDFEHLKATFEKYNPEFVFHLAAQPIVKESYNNPVYTYQTNVIGTVNVLEISRKSRSVKSIVNVTTDKVYENNEWHWGYREIDALNGYDPYSNSKSCSELVTDSYKKSFLIEKNISVSTARAGNVIGGGDFAPNRIIPDCIRSVIDKKTIILRNPDSIRPYQHVLEPLIAYLNIGMKQYHNINLSSAYNIGPNTEDCIKTSELTNYFCKSWGRECSWISKADNGPHEAKFLKLDTSKIRNDLKWNPIWSVEKAIDKTVEWSKCFLENADLVAITIKQYYDYIDDMEAYNE